MFELDVITALDAEKLALWNHPEANRFSAFNCMFMLEDSSPCQYVRTVEMINYGGYAYQSLIKLTDMPNSSYYHITITHSFFPDLFVQHKDEIIKYLGAKVVQGLGGRVSKNSRRRIIKNILS